MNIRRCRKSSSFNRHGAVLILTIVCVAIAVSVMAMLVRFALLHHAVQKNFHRSTQAGWLVESALDRAAACLALDPAYEGETWTIPAAEFRVPDVNTPGNSAMVRIEVETLDGEPQQRAIRVVADYPHDTLHRARRSKQIVVTLVEPEPDQPAATKEIGSEKPKETESESAEPVESEPGSFELDDATSNDRKADPIDSDIPETDNPKPNNTKPKNTEPADNTQPAENGAKS